MPIFYTKDGMAEVWDVQPEGYLTQEEYLATVSSEKKALDEITGYKRMLAAMDYYALKHYERQISDAEFAVYEKMRFDLRNKIRTLEGKPALPNVQKKEYALKSHNHTVSQIIDFSSAFAPMPQPIYFVYEEGFYDDKGNWYEEVGWWDNGGTFHSYPTGLTMHDYRVSFLGGWARIVVTQSKNGNYMANLPNDGTWAYYMKGSAGIAAGGAAVKANSADDAGFAWRIK
ncbi:MAG: hypothetical protein LBH05_07875 [Deferribacteraceae bacterium]|jgi:hypothetical protein|nr:hypothetical protein [Deferribacteraceae bacterium]